MSEFSNFVNEQLQNPDFRKEYDALEAEYSIKQALIDAHCGKHEPTRIGEENGACAIEYQQTGKRKCKPIH